MAKRILSFTKKEASQGVAIVICLFLIFWVYSCESTVQSITHPDKEVTRAELQIELDAYLAMAETRFSQLDRQEQFKRILFENAFVISQTGSVNFQGLIATLLAVLGVGAIGDNVRKRIEVKKLNNAGKENA